MKTFNFLTVEVLSNEELASVKGGVGTVPGAWCGFKPIIIKQS